MSLLEMNDVEITDHGDVDVVPVPQQTLLEIPSTPVVDVVHEGQQVLLDVLEGVQIAADHYVLILLQPQQPFPQLHPLSHLQLLHFQLITHYFFHHTLFTNHLFHVLYFLLTFPLLYLFLSFFSHSYHLLCLVFQSVD